MKIYLARHGQNEDNLNGVLNGHRDLPLTDLGREQAANLATYLKDNDLNFDLVLTSPLSRAKETATVITSILNINQPTIEEMMIERNFGEMTGNPISSIKELCAPDIIETETITYFLSPPGAETFPDLLERANKFLDHITKKYNDKENVLLVGHGDFGKMIYAQFYGLDWKEVLVNFHFGNSEILLLQEGLDSGSHRPFTQIQHNH